MKTIYTCETQNFLSYLSALPFPILFGIIVLGCMAFASLTQGILK